MALGVSIDVQHLSMKQNCDTLTIYRSKTIFYFLVGLALMVLVILVAYWRWGAADGPWIQGRHNVLLYVGLATLTIILGKLVYDAVQLWWTRASLVITPTGVVDNISRHRLGMLAWEDVARISLCRPRFGGGLRFYVKRTIRSRSGRIDNYLEIPELDVPPNATAHIRKYLNDTKEVNKKQWNSTRRWP